MRIESADWYRERAREIEGTPEFLLETLKLEFAEELSRLLEEQGLSRQQLADRLGTSRAYVTRTLRTDYNLTAETTVKVARVLDSRVELALVPGNAPKVARGVPVRVRHRDVRREFVAADRLPRSARNEFVASDKPPRGQRNK